MHSAPEAPTIFAQHLTKNNINQAQSFELDHNFLATNNIHRPVKLQNIFLCFTFFIAHIFLPFVVVIQNEFFDEA